MGSNPTGAIFDEIYFVLCNFRSVRQTDRNASDFLIVKNLINIHLSINEGNYHQIIK